MMEETLLSPAQPTHRQCIYHVQQVWPQDDPFPVPSGLDQRPPGGNT